MLAKLLSGYKTLAILFLNTTLLLVFLTLLAYWVLPSKTYHEPVYSRAFKAEAYQRTDPETMRAVWREYDDMGERSSYQFHPWTVFIEAPYNGKFLGVSAQNIRRTIEPSPAGEGKAELVVWMFGGSTMFGWGMPDSQTIPSHLQQILQDRLPTYRVVVVNHGHAYWFSSLELSHFIALLRREKAPNAVVFLDGLNDSIQLPAGRDVPYFSDQAFDAWERERLRRYGTTTDEPWMKLNDSFPLLRITHALLRRIGGEKKREEPPSHYFQKPDDPLAFSLKQFRINRDLIRTTGKQLQIETFQFLQPLAVYGEYVTTFKIRAAGPKVMAQFYDVLRAEPPNGFYPIHDVLYDLPHPFVDDPHYYGHYGDEACFRIADRMASIMLSKRDWLPRYSEAPIHSRVHE